VLHHPHPRPGSTSAVLVGALSIVIGLGALLAQFFWHPLGRGMAAYDYSTPDGTFTAQWKSMIDRNYRADADYFRKVNQPYAQKRLNSLEFGDTDEWDDGTFVFFSAEDEKGKTQYIVNYLVRDERSGLYKRTSYDRAKLEKSNLKLLEKIKNWQNKTSK
jgi:hypothetical protein